jgi:hypothetical protein
MNHPLTPFVDKLAVPPRRVIGEPTRLTARLETELRQCAGCARIRPQTGAAQVVAGSNR